MLNNCTRKLINLFIKDRACFSSHKRNEIAYSLYFKVIRTYAPTRQNILLGRRKQIQQWNRRYHLVIGPTLMFYWRYISLRQRHFHTPMKLQRYMLMLFVPWRQIYIEVYAWYITSLWYNVGSCLAGSSDVNFSSMYFLFWNCENYAVKV